MRLALAEERLLRLEHVLLPNAQELRTLILVEAVEQTGNALHEPLALDEHYSRSFLKRVWHRNLLESLPAFASRLAPPDYNRGPAKAMPIATGAAADTGSGVECTLSNARDATATTTAPKCRRPHQERQSMRMTRSERTCTSLLDGWLGGARSSPA